MAMGLNELRGKIVQVSEIYAIQNGIVKDRSWYALKIAEEAGEVSSAYLSLVGQARSTGSERDPRLLLADELADLISHALLLSYEEKIDIEAAIDRKWLRYLSHSKEE